MHCTHRIGIVSVGEDGFLDPYGQRVAVGLSDFELWDSFPVVWTAIVGVDSMMEGSCTRLQARSAEARGAGWSITANYLQLVNSVGRTVFSYTFL
jgi:hypothetical protein